jgi:broad specificity phosphatase PhoE
MAQFRGPAWAAIWSSTERKAMDGAEILAGGRGFRTLAALGENDRSATGYLPRDAFEAMADAFFAQPETSVRGWERAIDAQSRIVAAVAQVAAQTPGDGPVAIVSHGGVGALLLSHLAGTPIARATDQPPGTGGHFFVFAGHRLIQGWRAIDAAP